VRSTAWKCSWCGMIMLRRVIPMSEFLHDLFEGGFVFYSILICILASISSGIVGTYVVIRRITYIAGGIAHCVLGGMGLAVYLKWKLGWAWLTPMHGAVPAALAAAIIIGLVSLHAKEREDTIIGALWAIGMAAGLLLTHITPGYQSDLPSFLFGDISILSLRDVLIVAGLDVVVLLAVAFFYNPFLAVCFDEEFARSRGVPVQLVYLLLLCVTALTVVLLTTVVGVIMVIALLALPAAIANQFTKTLKQMMVVAVLLSMGLTTGGYALSHGPDLPSGPVIVILAGLLYVLVMGGKYFLKRRSNKVEA
jgi:zinc transport system permease protein